MLIKMLGLVFAGVFVGAAAVEMKTDRHGKKKERQARDSDESDRTSKASGAAPASTSDNS